MSRLSESENQPTTNTPPCSTRATGSGMADSALLKDVIDSNKSYAAVFDRCKLAIPPAKKLAIVACMDARLTVEDFLGLRTGDAHIIRHAGGIVTEDAIRSLIISNELLGTREFLVINHTDWGVFTVKDRELQEKVTKKASANAARMHFP